MFLSIDKLKIETECKDKYLIYTRRSTDDTDNQRNTIEFQTEAALRFARQYGLSLASIDIPMFCENGIIKEYHSGFKESKLFEILPDGMVKQKVDRPKFLAMANLLQRKYFKGVVCLCWDRISRNKGDDVIIDKLIFQGVAVRFVEANYETTSSGHLHMDIDGMFSRHYSRVISEKVRHTLAKLRSEGKCTYRSPVGYLDEGSSVKALDPAKAPIVKRLFELYATGEWSYASLAVWANKEGLTAKATRRQRTKVEKLEGVELKTIPKVSKPITSKAVEKILANPFYIGKILFKGNWIDSKAHQPLLDTSLFMKVRQMRNQKTTSVYYPERKFITYRGLIACSNCRRRFSPYVHKGIIYYRLKCKAGCTNQNKNIKEEYITSQVLEILSKIYFTKEEILEIEKDAQKQLAKVAEKRDNDLNDAYRRLNKAMADLDFLAKERLTLLRTEAMTVEDIVKEEIRLKNEIDSAQLKISANVESAQAMLDYILTFSQLLEGAANYFEFALDSEKRDLVQQIFSELSFFNDTVKYQANEGFNSLLRVKCAFHDPLGAPQFLFSNLEQIFLSVKAIRPKLEARLTVTK